MQNWYAMNNCMPSIWCNTSNCEILHLTFQIFSDNQWQKLWEKLLFGQFCVSSPFPFLPMLRNIEQKLRQAMLSVLNIVWGRGRILNTPFKIPIIFCHWLSNFLSRYSCVLFGATDYRRLNSLESYPAHMCCSRTQTGSYWSEAVLHKCSKEKVFWKYEANLHENTHAEVQFQ